MRTGRLYVLLAALACAGVAPGQTPAVQPPENAANSNQDQSGNSPAPLTPLEQREQQIRQVDPLARNTEDPKDKATGNAKKPQEQDATPGSIAATEQQNRPKRSGPEVVDDDAAGPTAQDYTGPAVLSRSYSINTAQATDPVRWRESFGLNTVYDSGIRALPGSNSNQLAGSQATWAISGGHVFHHDQVTASFTGTASLFPGAGQYSGSNQLLSLSWTRTLSRRLLLNVGASGSILSQNYTLENPSAGPGTIANVDLGSSPSILVYDTGTKQLTTQVDVTWQKSTRLSFNFGASWFGTVRNSPLLLGVTGQQARNDVNYRLTRKMTVGAYYSFNHYLYPHGFGDSDTNTGGLIFSYALGRSMQIRFRGGASRVESLGLQTIPLDPVIAALLGVGTGVVDVHQTVTTSDFSAQLIKDFRGGSTGSFSYARGVSPGNGVFQTSQQESLSGSLTMRVFRTYDFQSAIGQDTLGSIGQSFGRYRAKYARLGFSRAYRRGVGVNFQVEYRHFDVLEFASLRNQFRITSGVTWNSGAGGRLWPF